MELSGPIHDGGAGGAHRNPGPLAHLLETLRNAGIEDGAVLAAIAATPREWFFDGPGSLLYDDLPIDLPGGGRSPRPGLVALMIECLAPFRDAKILEIGTGAGWQTALLARFSRRVFTVDRSHALAEGARRRLRARGFENVACLVADPTLGWKAYGPYDRIIVWGGVPGAPPSLLSQLALQGRMIAPIGPRGEEELLAILRDDDFHSEPLCGVRIDPLLGAEGWPA